MINDLAARQHALDPNRSFIVQAPAGSGKTGLLVYRILTLLTTVERPEQILAITFTRKATNEMRERLLYLLHKAEHQEQSDDPFEQQGIMLAKAALKRDKQYAWRLLDTPNQLQIQTIDAFCTKLTGYMPWLSRLGDKARTTDQPHTHYAAAVEQLFNELLTDQPSVLSDAIKTVLFELDFNYVRARKLFIAMLAKRDQWLRHLLHHDFVNLRTSLEQTWHDIANSHLENLDQLLPLPMQQQLLTMIGRAAELVEKPNTPLTDCQKLANTDRIGDNLKLWRAVKFVLLTNDSKGFRKRLDKNCGFPTTDKQHKINMTALLEQLRDDETLRVALSELDYLPNANFSDDDWQQLCALEQVLKALAGLLQLRFRAAGECDHSEVTQRANMALQDLSSPTELALRMDYQLQHILVDEFQDTSHAQIALLKKLTSGWCTGDAIAQQTLFLVGDPMQSIYRFREADVSLFLRVADDAKDTNQNRSVFSNLSIESLRLTENFRSNITLVEWFNNTFKRCFPSHNHIMSGAIKYAEATSNNTIKKTKPVVSCIGVSDKLQQAQQLVKTIQKIQQEYTQRADLKQPKIAMLVRSRTHLATLLPALQAANIDYLGVDIQPLKETQAVVDVMALCKAICRLDDRVSWFALLRGPWCGLTLAQIKKIVPRDDVLVWHQLCHACSEHSDQQTQPRLKHFVDIMQQTQQQRQQVPLHSIAYWAWQQLGGEHTLFDASIDDVQALFDLIAQLEKGGDITSLSDLERALDGLYAKPTQHKQATVIVSTIHKAKGLQYDTVILPSLASPARAEDKNVMMWAEHIDKIGSEQLLLAPIRMQQSEGSHYDYLRALEKQRSRNEAIRLMYVACTRAERQLVLISPLHIDAKTEDIRPPNQSSLLATVWPALEDAFMQNTVVTNDPESLIDGESLLSQDLFRLPDHFVISQAPSIEWQAQQQVNAQVERSELGSEQGLQYEWAGSVAQAVGIILHDWLQFHGHRLFEAKVDQQQRQHWRAELLALNVLPEKFNACLTRLQTAIDNMQADDNARFIFKHYSEQNNEYALSCLEHDLVKTYRIDRTFVDENNVRWIVDYKTTISDVDNIDQFVDEQIATRHRQQLQKYAELMHDIDPRPIKLGVYFPLLKQWRTWGYEY